MPFTKRFGQSGLAASALMLLVAGCSGGGTPQASQKNETPPVKTPAPAQPVTIRIGSNPGQMSADEVTRYVAEPVKKKYPNITIEYVNFSTTGQNLSDLVAAKQAPDLVANGIVNITKDFIPLGLAYDMTELIKKNGFDLNRIQPVYFDAIRTASGQTGVIGMPIWNQAFGLVYNKGLFDKFAAAYPKDGMTWDQVRDIAAKLTRNEGGIQYYGLWVDDVYRGANQLSLPFADWKTNKSLLQSQDWKDLFTLWTSLYQVPGFAAKGTDYRKMFYQGQLAMMSGSTSTAQTMLTYPEVDWDVVTYPQNPKAPGVAQRVTDFDLFMTATSANKDAAFQVISVVLSDEVQSQISRNGRMSSLTSADIQNQFGKDIPQFQSKNVLAFTKPKLAAMPEYKYNVSLDAIVNEAFNTVLYDGKDINTALRDGEEKMNQAIQAALNK